MRSSYNKGVSGRTHRAYLRRNHCDRNRYRLPHAQHWPDQREEHKDHDSSVPNRIDDLCFPHIRPWLQLLHALDWRFDWHWLKLRNLQCSARRRMHPVHSSIHMCLIYVIDYDGSPSRANIRRQPSRFQSHAQPFHIPGCLFLGMGRRLALSNWLSRLRRI